MRWCGWKINRPDSAWLWVTLMSSTLVMSATFGFLANFGIFYSRFLVEYKESREKTAWVGSIPLCIRSILACLGTWITVKYGLRKAAIPAGFLLGGSFIASSYAKNLDQLFATFSIPFGLAGCVLLMVCNISMFRYFDKQLPVALGKYACWISHLHLNTITSGGFRGRRALDRNHMWALVWNINIFSCDFFSIFSQTRGPLPGYQKRGAWGHGHPGHPGPPKTATDYNSVQSLLKRFSMAVIIPICPQDA